MIFWCLKCCGEKEMKRTLARCESVHIHRGKKERIFMTANTTAVTVDQSEDFFRDTGELTLQIPTLPRPTLAELKAKFDWIKSIERDTSPTGPVTLKLATVFRPYETKSINGAEYERRFAPKHKVLLGYQQREWLIEHQKEFPELMALLGKIYIDFPGLVMVREDGNRDIPYACQGDERWDPYWGWVDRGFNRFGRVAIYGK